MGQNAMTIEFTIKSGNPEKQRTACVVVGIYEGKKLSPAAITVDTASKQYLSNIIRRGDIAGRRNQTLLLHSVPGVVADRVLLVGCGKEKELDDAGFRQAVRASIEALTHTGAIDAVSYLSELKIKGCDHYWKVKQAVLTASSVLYRFNELKSDKKKMRKALHKITFTVPTRRELDAGEKGLNDGRAIANGINLARDLANRPANICTPKYLAGQARQLGRNFPSLEVHVLDEAQMKKLGMGSLLSVAQGSSEAAKLITFEYRGGKKNAKPVVLVGKGVTFDTGGISIKPAAAMDEMKFDMCGAASVFGTMRVVAELKLPINVVGVVPATENMPGSKATRPGDIVTSMSGQTIEILNTDAEGRLILCDALTYSEKFNPDVVIDIATLTGACVIALGAPATGLLSNDKLLAKKLLSAGKISGDRAWQLPLWDDYQQQLNSPFADMANIGGREAGTITAACFLARFTDKYQWAHLDIAGTAWKSGKQKGATGRPVGLLTQYIIDRCK